MAKLSAHGRTLLKFYDRKRRTGVAIMSDGKVLHRDIRGGWRNPVKLIDGLTPDLAVAKVLGSTSGRYIVNALPPTIETMWKWSNDGVAKATDGCRVEPDGVCPHGANSWMIELGTI